MPLVSLALNGDTQTIAPSFASQRDRTVMPGKRISVPWGIPMSTPVW